MDKLTIILKNDECIERIAEAFTLELDECDNLRIRSIRKGQAWAVMDRSLRKALLCVQRAAPQRGSQEFLSVHDGLHTLNDHGHDCGANRDETARHRVVARIPRRLLHASRQLIRIPQRIERLEQSLLLSDDEIGQIARVIHDTASISSGGGTPEGSGAGAASGGSRDATPGGDA